MMFKWFLFNWGDFEVPAVKCSVVLKPERVRPKKDWNLWSASDKMLRCSTYFEYLPTIAIISVQAELQATSSSSQIATKSAGFSV